MNDQHPLILAIDDSPANLLLLGMALQPDFEVQIATSGAAGLALAAQAHPDLILLDIMMPDMDGFEVCRHLKADPALRDIPVVFVSALTEHESESAGFALGAADYITKPVNVEIARHRISNLLEREALRNDLLAQRDQLQAMLNNDLVGIVKSAHRTILWTNPAFEKMLGYGPGELVGVATRQVNADEESYAAVAAAYPVLAAGGIFRAQIQYVKKTGERIWVDLSGAMLDQKTDECLWTLLDITSRKRAQDELRQQLRFTAALNQVAQAIIDTQDISALLQRVTAIASQTLGREPAQVYNPDDTCLLRELNQLSAHHAWTQPERDFLEALVRQVDLALDKIRLIDAQRQAQDQLQLAASVFSHAREGITITTPDGTIIDVNAAFTRITGYERAEVLGKNPSLLGSGRHPPAFFADMWQQLAEHGYWHGELWNRRKSGEIYPEMLTISAVRDEAGKTGHYVALFSDVTTLKAHQDQLDRLAHYDALTHLPNRALLADRLRQGMAVEQRRGKKLAVVFLDLDGFKAVNDTYGHEAGDQLLITLAAVMKQALREGDTLARIGGDEFVAVLGDLENAEASVPVLTRMLHAAAQPLMVSGVLLQVSASVGVTCYPQAQPMEADQLLRQADQAMYRAKVAGKNRYRFFDSAQDGGPFANAEVGT